MKEATLEMEETLDPEELKEHVDPETEEALPGHSLTVEETGINQIEEGGGRYKKSYFGASVAYEIHCSCQSGSGKPHKPVAQGDLSDKVPASSMDENY